MLLTQEERDKFAAYLEQEAQTDAGLADQMAKIGAPEVLARQYRASAAAAALIAGKLRSTESAIL